MKTFLEALSHFWEQKKPFVVATMVDVKLSAPQKIGAKAIFRDEGIVWGTIGGGKLEAFVIQSAKNLLLVDSHEHQLLTVHLKKDIGMTCGGIVSVFLERFLAFPWEVNVFGAGHVAQALVPILASLDIKVRVFDTRPEWLSRFPIYSQVGYHLVHDWSESCAHASLSGYFVCVTQGHSTDVPVLKTLLQKGVPRYVGVIGSASKAIVLKRELVAQGVEKERVNYLRCPIGISLGGHSPGEIAISIVAELISCRYQKEGSSFKTSSYPEVLHENSV